MWRRRRQPLDRETVDGIIRKLMAIDAKLVRILERLDIGDEEEEDDS
jgi:hypothetical protein